MAVYRFEKNELIPEGFYLLEVVDASTKVSRERKMEIWTLNYEIKLAEDESLIGRRVTEMVFFTEEAAPRLATLMNALYPDKKGSGEEITCDSSDQIGKRVWARIFHLKERGEEGTERLAFADHRPESEIPPKFKKKIGEKNGKEKENDPINEL